MTLRRNYDATIDNIIAKPIIADALAGLQGVERFNEEYQILLEFDLKREKEKNMILEERLKNKELFIQQMKHFQEQLTVAYEQCKNDLILAQQKIEYLQNVEFREYTEQIAELKHMLLLKNQQTKRHSLSRDERQAFSHSNTRLIKEKREKQFSGKHADRFQSKFTSNLVTERERSSTKFQQQVSKQIKKAANFIMHFLQMSQCYVKQQKNGQKLTKKLKRSWKWIKDVVKEWDTIKQKNKSFQKFREHLAKLYDTDCDADLSVLLQIIRNDKQGSAN